MWTVGDNDDDVTHWNGPFAVWYRFLGVARETSGFLRPVVLYDSKSRPTSIKTQGVVSIKSLDMTASGAGTRAGERELRTFAKTATTSARQLFINTIKNEPRDVIPDLPYLAYLWLTEVFARRQVNDLLNLRFHPVLYIVRTSAGRSTKQRVNSPI